MPQPDTLHTRFKAGDLIMEQGSSGDCAYIIEEGLVDIVITHPNGETQIIASRGTGSIIGEMALMDQKHRTASIVAVEDCTMIQIRLEDFKRRLDASDPIMKMITKVILNRYRDTLSRVEVFAEASDNTAENRERKMAKAGKAIEHLKIGHEFKHAISNNELSLYYQPIIDMSTLKVKGFEALMRWNHPIKGFMPPNLFIPIAEDSGLIVAASDWAMEESCKSLNSLKNNCPSLDDDTFMSINFTAIDMLHPDFLNKLLAACQRHKINPAHIKIEMTERLLMNNPEKVKEMLGSCRNAGFSIAIDDFGTGYSSLSYLHHYPIDTLKIDRSFIMQMNKNEGALNLVRGIINLAKSMNMLLVAEGVEEEIEEKLLIQNSCDMVQGYKYSKPLPEDRIIEWINNLD